MFGKRLKKLRGNTTQQEIADKLGVSRASYSHYENDHVEADNEILLKMADLFKVSTDYLLGRTNVSNHTLNAEHLGLIEKLDLSDDDLLDFPIFIEGRELTDEEKKRLFRMARALLESDQQ